MDDRGDLVLGLLENIDQALLLDVGGSHVASSARSGGGHDGRNGSKGNTSRDSKRLEREHHLGKNVRGGELETERSLKLRTKNRLDANAV